MPVSTTAKNAAAHALHHKRIVYPKDVDFINPLRLKLVKTLDVSWDMRIARRGECSRNADLS